MRLCKVARFCAFLRVFALFGAFLCVFLLPKWPAEKRKIVQNRAKMCKKRFYAIPPLVIPPFACHRLRPVIIKWVGRIFEISDSIRQENPEGPTIKQNLISISKFSISIEIFDLARKF